MGGGLLEGRTIQSWPPVIRTTRRSGNILSRQAVLKTENRQRGYASKTDADVVVCSSLSIFHRSLSVCERQKAQLLQRNLAMLLVT